MFQRFSSRLHVQQNCNIQWLITKTNTVNKEIIIDLLTCKKVCFQLKEIYLQKKGFVHKEKRFAYKHKRNPRQTGTLNSHGK